MFRAKAAPTPTVLPESELLWEPGFLALASALTPALSLASVPATGLLPTTLPSLSFTSSVGTLSVVPVPVSAFSFASLFFSGAPASVTAAVATVSSVLAVSVATWVVPPTVMVDGVEPSCWTMVAFIVPLTTAMATLPATPTFEAPAPAMA